MAELANLKAAFNAMDADASGFLERQEIIDGLKEHGYNFIDKEVDDMIASVDVDGNGKVDYSEFVIMMTQKLANVPKK